MASTEQLRSLAEEATCPICLGYFAEPVSVHCRHTFCTPCITRYWQGVLGPPYPCPQCRETAPTNTLRPNRQLANMVQILAQGAPVAPPREEHLMCTEHDEKLKLFCQEDQTPICVVCDRSREHRGHTVTPIREAAQEYKDKFQSYLDDVKKKLENVLGLQLKEEAGLIDAEDVKSILSRFENVKSPLPNSGHLKEKEKETEKPEEEKQEDVAEDRLIKILESLEWRCARSYAGAVTLDPDTAHRDLVLSADGRSARDGGRAQELPDTPERFNPSICVLGKERLSAGRHYWEVEVGHKTNWELGVCDESTST